MYAQRVGHDWATYLIWPDIQDIIETIIIHYKTLIIVSYAIVGPCCLSILCIVVSANPEFLIYLFLHTPVPFGNYKFFFYGNYKFFFYVTISFFSM